MNRFTITGILASFYLAHLASAATFTSLNSPEPADGSFLWDTFSNPYAGPHSVHTSTGTGTASLSVTAGGIITGAGNLYSMFSSSTWTIDLAGLATSSPHTTVALQIAATTGANDIPLNAPNLTISGVSPTLFESVRTITEGTNEFHYYLATWEGLSATSNYQIVMDGTVSRQHTSLDGVEISYFNTNSSNLNVIPEPTSGLFSALGLLAFLRIRRRS